MTKTFELLQLAKRNGIHIFLHKGELQLKISKGNPIDPQLLQEIKNNKLLLTEFLNSSRWKSKKVEAYENELRPFERAAVQHIPLSFSQERMWFIDKLEGTVAYHLPAVLHVKGQLYTEALGYAFKAIVKRHEVLRSVIREHDGQGYQFVMPEDSWQLSFSDTASLINNTHTLKEEIQNLVTRPFDLSGDYMLRASLLRLSADEHILAVTVHHIAADGWSLSIIVKELVELYNSCIEKRFSTLSPLSLQYADYAYWQRTWFRGEMLDSKIAYWKNKLEGVLPLQLPTDFERPAIQSMEGTTTGFVIDQELTARLAGLNQQHQTTLFMLMMAACQVLMYRYSGQSDVCIGTPIANRPYQEVEELVGFFINTLAIRSELGNNIPFDNLLQQVRETVFEAYEHQEVPFEKVVEAVMKQRDLGRHPLFQVMLIFQNTPDIPELKLGNIQLSHHAFENHTARFDLTFNITENTEGMQVSVEYCTRLFRENTIHRLIGHFRQLLYSIAAEPNKGVDDLAMITREEEARLLQDAKNPVAEYGSGNIITLFQQQAAITPEAIALVFEQKELTYSQLHHQSNQLAHYLIGKGVQKETLVPVFIERSAEMVIAILGILKAGAAFVPIDPDYPAERTGFMLADTGASLVITGTSVKHNLKTKEGIDIIVLDECTALSEQPITDLPVHSEVNRLAYVIYTSGSTGLPKGVMVQHGGLANLLHSIRNEVSFNASGVFLSVTTYSFDISYLELFVPIISGGKLVIASREAAIDGYLLQQKLTAHKATHMQATPGTWQLLQNSGWQNPGKIKILVGGEALSEDLKNYLTEKGDSWNVYGPTETTIWSAIKKLSKAEKVNIGIPLINNRMYILDKSGQLCPVGVAGEIGIGGVQVARGYLNRPELTKEKFVTDPFSPVENARMFKTGDLGLRLEDGNIVCLGRMDDQVKIHGYRIELSEIETVLQQHRSVRQAVVAAKNDGQGNKRLVGYIVPGDSFNKEEIILYLKEKLPVYMVPALWVELQSVPLLPNGKTDRKALPDADVSGLLEHQYVAPQNETEEILADIWKKVLLVKQVGIHDNFFELGGHSLRALQVISLIRRDLKTEPGIREFFLHPTVAQLAAYLLKQKQHVTIDSIGVDTQRPERIPLSFSQERLWFIDQMEGSFQYHVPAVLRMKGKLDRQALQFALQSIVIRHEILRTVIYIKDGQGYQQIKEPGPWQLEITDASACQPESLKKKIHQLISKPFDLSGDYMFRASLIHVGEQEHVLVVTMHHIASDAWSVPVMIEEVTRFYKAYMDKREVQLPKLSFQYADYAIWQRKNLHGAKWDQKEAYWKQKLEGVSPLQLPADFPRPVIKSTRGAAVSYVISKETVTGIQKLGNSQGATLYMTLLAAFKVMLYRYSGQQDITVGTSVANRNKLELERMVGFFVNTIAFRDEIDGETTFTALLNQVKNTTLEAYEYQDVPFEKVVEMVVKDRNPGISPVFQVMLVLRNMPDKDGLQLGEIVFSSEAFEQTAVKFDITFFVHESPGGLTVVAEYSTDLYREATILRMLDHYDQILFAVTQTPGIKIGLLPMLTSSEQHRLQQGWNRATVSYPKDATVVSLFEQQAAKTPGAIAVVFEGNLLTFDQLNHKASLLADVLQQKGVRKNSVVPLFVERSANMLIGILGILKTGAAYVPVDTDFPDGRISYMLKDTAATIVVSSIAGTKQLQAISSTIDIVELDAAGIIHNSPPITNITTEILPDDLAYVIYTSGSTGTPKGVMIEHRHLIDYVFGLNQQVSMHRCKSYALVSTIATDLGNTVIFSSLLLGGTLHVFSKDTVSNANYLYNYFSTHEIDCLKIVPSHWKFLSPDDTLLLPATLLIFGGEALPAEYVKAIQATAPGCRVVNHYGPTETTIGKLLHVLDKQKEYQGTIPIGRPFSNTAVYVLSKEMQLCPVGVAGQLYIGGDGVGRGYLNNDELTQQKFIPNPFKKDGATLLYATGDRVKWLEDGNIHFIGRVDNQVKIRGYRVEPGEIENILQQSEGVAQAVVLAKDDSQGNKRLTGYIVPHGYFDREGIIAYLKEKVPEYMVPSVLVALEALPLTHNGKIDRQALPDPDGILQSEGQYIAPRNEIEKSLAGIWEEVLEVEQAGIHDDFFLLGGHSLLAIRLISAIRKNLGAEVSIGAVFDYPTIAGLATQLSLYTNESALPPVTAVHPRPQYIPLSFSQERLWFIDRLEGSLHYHLPTVLQLKGNLDIDALSFSLQQIINRHEVLRTVIGEKDGQPFQLIKEKNNWQLTVTDGSAYEEDADGLHQHITQLINTPFNLSADDLLRASLISTGRQDYVLVVTLHHILSDAYSTPIIVSELAALYNSRIAGTEARLPQLPVQYADYALWQRNYLQGPVLETKLAYWKKQLEGTNPLQLPTDYARPLVQSTRGAIIHFNISRQIADGLTLMANQQSATLFMVLLSAFKVLLHRYSGQQDICVGTPVAGRQQQETEGLIGFFINSIALRTEINGDATFAALLQLVRATTVAAYGHQEVPFEKVVEQVAKNRDMSRSPVFQVMLTLQNTPETGDLRLDGLQLSNEGNSVVTHTTSKFDCTFFISETAQGLQVSVEYCTDLFKEVTIRQMAAHFTNLLQAAIDQPQQSIGRLPMLGESEVAGLLAESDNTKTVFADNRSVVAMFKEQVVNRPDAVAAVFGDERISYSQLNLKADRLSHYLIAKGVTTETLVPVCMKRSIELLVCMLGILKSGGAYVPIDPEYPQERIQFMLQDTASSLLLTSREVAAHLPPLADVEVIDVEEVAESEIQPDFQDVQLMAEPHHLAYVIYTSGSTGRPKGVMIEHKSLTNLVNWHIQAYEVTPESRATAMAGIGFDAFGWEVWPYIACGATLYMISDEVRLNQTRLAAVFTDNKITHSFVATALAEEFVKSSGNRTTSLQYLLTGGDKLPSIDVENLSCKLVNNYGPTENTVVATNYLLTGIDGKRIPPIGKAIANTAIYLLDEYNQMVPSGVWGEICIGGVQVARGYLNQPELTADRFITNPFDAAPHARLYKTGDLARRVADGSLEYGGRKDSQVKIRGYRIEPGEIESELQNCNLVKDAVVVAIADDTGNLLLAGYIVPENSFNKEGISTYLKNKLPAYMIPSVWIELDKLPLTANGKVDKQALPELDGSFLTGTEYVAPRTETEEKLAAIWQHLLRKQQVGMYDNFFEMGGHSLMAMRMITHIEESLFVSVPIKALFQFTCINDLGKYLDMQATGMPDKPASTYRFIDV